MRSPLQAHAGVRALSTQDDATHHKNQSAPASWHVVVEPCAIVFVAGKESLDIFPRNYGLYPAIMLEPLEEPGDGGDALSVLDEARIREAIAFGEEHPGKRLRRHVTLAAKRVPTDEQRWLVGTVSTPFTRVAMGAHRARQGAVRLKLADVQKEWLEPKLHVYVCSRVYQGLSSPPVRVFIRPARGSLDEKVRATVPAERLAPMPPAYHRLFFDHYQITVGHGLMAVFPLSVLTADSEVYVEYVEQQPLCPACGATLPPQPGAEVH